NLLGYRTRKFYKKLASRQNCILVEASVASNMMIPLFDGVVICTGSVGFEAALRGVPVYSDCEPFHLPATHVMPLSRLSTSSPAPIPPAPPLAGERNQLIDRLLQGLIPGRFVNDGGWNGESEADLKAGRLMA